MSTAADNKYGVTCEGNVCTTPDGITFTYNSEAGTVTADGVTYPVSDDPSGMTNPIKLGDFISGASGYIDVPED